jgi:predicted RNA-binding protein YlxR (DUF448 family)
MRRENLRKDIASSKGYPKKALFRFSHDKGGSLVLDLEQCLPGRGVYLHKDFASIDLAKKKNILARYQKGAIDPTLYERLKGAL